MSGRSDKEEKDMAMDRTLRHVGLQNKKILICVKVRFILQGGVY
jgi:hypothetical protein